VIKAVGCTCLIDIRLHSMKVIKIADAKQAQSIYKFLSIQRKLFIIHVANIFIFLIVYENYSCKICIFYRYNTTNFQNPMLTQVDLDHLKASLDVLGKKVTPDDK
jgi:hypothetical protein